MMKLHCDLCDGTISGVYVRVKSHDTGLVDITGATSTAIELCGKCWKEMCGDRKLACWKQNEEGDSK